MPNHTQLKIFFAGVMIALATLSIVTAPAQVMSAGQYKSSAVVALPQDTRGSTLAPLPAPPEAGNAERVAVSRSPKITVNSRATTPGSSLSFLPAVAYDSGGSGEAGDFRTVAVADVNGDGKPDMVVANFWTSTVGVLLGNGDGTFQPAVSFNAGIHSPTAIAIADVNGDGKPDLVVGIWSGGVGVLLGNGDGTFQPGVAYASGGVQVSEVEVADLNHDGKPDLIVANFGSVLGVLLGNGDGTFKGAVTYPAGLYPFAAAVADVNSDGNADLLVADGEFGGAAVVLGNGDGSFKAAVTYGWGGMWAQSIAVADVNGDGKLDLVVANCATAGCEHGAAAVLLGNGDGTFQAAVDYDSGGAGANGLAIADVDGNGKPDLLVANWVTNSVGVLLGNGDGTFQPAVTYSSGGLYPMAIIAADLNGDGKPDLVVRNECADSGCVSGSIGVLLNNTTEGKSATSTLLVSSLNPSIYGQKVSWTATVTSSGSIKPTGNVRFTWSGYTIGSATLNSSGVATLTRSNLNADSYPLTAVYAGDAAHLGSTSAVLNQVVLETTSAATLTSSPNPSTKGQAVTFTAKISSPTVMPTGPVTFTSGKTVLGTAQLSGGKAKLAVSSLPVGSTKVTVTYYGDSNIAKSSAPVIQTVH
jgi:hypothetical protein